METVSAACVMALCTRACTATILMSIRMDATKNTNSLGKDVLKSLAMGAIGVSGATVIGRTVATSLIKLIPGAGTIMGGTAAAGTAAALTLALGKAYIGVCKSIKTGKLNLDELSQKKGQDVFKEAFRD